MNNFKALQLAINLYHQCVALKVETHLRDQLLRASSSVALNLSEGRGRRSHREQLQFFSIAFGSLRETQTILLLTTKSNRDVIQSADSAAACLYRLIKKIEGD